jgi:hypothetical protein
VALLIPEKAKVFVPVPSVGTVPEGTWGLWLEEELIRLDRVVLKGPWILEPVNPDELPEMKLGRIGRTKLVLGIGAKPAFPVRPLGGAWPGAGATAPNIEMRIRMNAPVRLQVICMILLLRRTGPARNVS